MPNVIGTTISLSSFLQNEGLTIKINTSLFGEQKIELRAEREYIIPSFQREIRWGKENVNVLLSDLDKGTIFLGNFILTIKENSECEIIDGQQRTTVLVLLLAWLRNKYQEELEIPVACKIRNRSFPGFQDLIDVGFDENRLSPEKMESIRTDDVLSQYPRIKQIWELFNDSRILCSRHRAAHIIDNLKRSQVNVIASRSNDVSNSIRYFLDVNLKGIHLDTEDIFKAYLFKQDSSDRIRTLWENNKAYSRKLNLAKGGKENSRYPLMKTYEHFFYCDLFLDSTENKKFASVSFKEDFCLTKNLTIDADDFYEGTHLIEVINNKAYMSKSLGRINSALQIMNAIVEADDGSDPFRRLFVSASQVDQTEVSIFHSLLKKIILDSEVIPKVLALKYIITFFDGKKHLIDEYRALYSVFAAAVVFETFSFKKRNEIFYGFVKSEDWIHQIKKWLYEYASSPELTKGKVVSAYQCDEDSSAIEAQIRCKSLAAIYNYFNLTKNGDSFVLRINDPSQLASFLHNSEVYSVEHFVISESKTLRIKTEKYDFSFKYPAKAAKCLNSLYNYIFIPRLLNRDLRNDPVNVKAAQLLERISEIKCSYSTECIKDLSKVTAHFPSYPSNNVIDSYSSEEDVRCYLKEYFQNSFPQEFFDFAVWRAQRISWIER